MLWRSATISAPHFYISRFFEDHQDEYIHLMREVSRTGDWEAWCRFFLNAVESQAVDNLRVAESIRSFYEEMKVLFASAIFTHPIFRNSGFTNDSGIPAATAARFTRVLIDEGLLQTVTVFTTGLDAMPSGADDPNPLDLLAWCLDRMQVDYLKSNSMVPPFPLLPPSDSYQIPQ